MLKNPRVIGVKNSSMPVQDIEEFRAEGCAVFNGPDEQLLSGLVAGAIGGIGGTYGAMPELYIKIYNLVKENKIAEAREIQDECLKIIISLCSCKGNMYAVIKAVLRKMGAPDCGGVRAPLFNLVPEDEAQIDKCVEMIKAAYAKYL
jgi:N-acetylneuraminate lyase